MQVPYLHPRWDDQMVMEQQMLALGKERMQAKINKAMEKKDMSNLRPYRSLLTEWVLPMAHEITAWKEKASKKRGVKPIALPLIMTVESETCALVTLRVVLRMLGVERRKVLGMAVEIGTWIEHEARVLSWIEGDKESWDAIVAIQKNRGSNATHMRRSRTSIFNKHISSKVNWLAWSEEQRIRVGLEMIDLLVRSTRRFKVVAEPGYKPKKVGKGVISRRPMVLEPDGELRQWLENAIDDELLHAPVFMPTLIPPKPWTGPRDGGYWTPFVKTPFLIRFKASHEDQRQRAIDDYEALDMPMVYSGLNHVQNTAWKINTKVLEIANRIWDNDLALGGLPNKEEETVPPRPEAAEHDEAVRKEWTKIASEIRTRNATRLSHYIAYRRAIVLANQMKDEPEFYYPHMLDFRGRMYPIVTDLSPQGEDLHRGLLTFAKGKPIETEEQALWLAIQVANTFGIDKVGLQERISWTVDREEEWRNVAKDPMEHRMWLEADDPWQALAAILEYAGFMEQGYGYVSSLPIRVDGTCNGIQHLSAMVRDEVGGRAVNLIPSDKPSDIYQEVADKITKELSEDPNDMAAMWLEVCAGHVPRSLTKRPVMILPYGGTRHAYFDYTMEWLKENDPRGEHIHEELRAQAVSYLVKILYEAVSTTVLRGQEVMKWLQACSKVASESGLPLYWKTPSGFVVRHFYGETDSVQIKTWIDGQVLQLRVSQTKPTLDKRSQAKGIAPNYVHSMDASALMICIEGCKRKGIDQVTAIHDAYGTVASDMWTMFDVIREAFIHNYKEDVLDQFITACCDISGETKDYPSVPPKGRMDLSEIRQSDYFFS
jgi:DNA-directed RNA polymerase